MNRSLREYLDALAGVGDRSAQYVLEHGEEFTWSPKPDDIEWGEAKGCYGNATMIALMGEDQEYVYYEGFALDQIMPVPHAWVVADGKVIDNTWRDSSNDECGFCFGEGVRLQCQESGYGDVDPDCEECDGCGCHEVPCFFCESTGKHEWPDRSQAIYFGVPVDNDTLRRCVLDEGTYGVLDKPFVYEEKATQ